MDSTQGHAVPWTKLDEIIGVRLQPRHRGVRRVGVRCGRELQTARPYGKSVRAALLVGVGTYCVLSYAVAQRRREIGLRMAIGARAGQIRGQFLAMGLRLLAAGAVLGAIGAWLTGMAMRTLLFRTPPLDAGSLAAAAGIIGAVSLAAYLLPSQQATRIAPVEALAEL